jgi:exonuclease SbcC
MKPKKKVDIQTDQEETRYIARVHLENFQDHADTVIEFEPGINLVTGSSDAGKSAALRAINFVLHNQPRGDAFIQLGASEARVAIEFSDGMTVQRIKGKSRNAVIVNHPNWHEPIVKDNFGNEYPDEVLEALGRPPIDKEQGPISYAEQMSPLFLVSLSASELPRCLSRLTGIDDFEEASKLLASRSREANKRAKESEQRIGQILKDLVAYDDLDHQLVQLELLEHLAANIEEVASEVSAGESLLARYDLVMQQGKAAYKALQDAKAIADLREEFDPIEQEMMRIDEGVDLLERLEALNQQEEQHHSALRRAEAVLGMADDFESLETLIDRISAGQDVLQRYDEVMRKGRSISKELEVWTQNRNRISAEHDELIETMRREGLWCNACNRPLAEDQCEVSA